MPKQKKRIGTSIAAAVAVAFMAIPNVPVLANTNDELVVCPGVNACKGQGACGTWSTHCGGFEGSAGSNACKGQGFLVLSKKECRKRGGQGIKYADPTKAPPALQSAESTSE